MACTVQTVKEANLYAMLKKEALAPSFVSFNVQIKGGWGLLGFWDFLPWSTGKLKFSLEYYQGFVLSPFQLESIINFSIHLVTLKFFVRTHLL
jgi:hypothetical protein